MKITERYSSAVRSGNLRSSPETTFSDSDVIGAFGLASKRHPLAVALQRLFMGDNLAASQIVLTLAENACGKAYRMGWQATEVQRADIARSVVAYWRHGTCTACSGRGFQAIEGAPYLGEQACTSCRGSKRRAFDHEIPAPHLAMARWMLAEVEREQAKAGSAAMAALAPTMVM